MKVADIMTKEVVSVQPSDKVVEVADLLQKKGLNGIPVVGNGKVLGMITEADLVSRGPAAFHIPSLIRIFHDLKLEKYFGKKQDENIRSFFEARADSVMSPNYVFIRPEAEITDLVKIFQEKHVNPIPVVDQEKNLVGIVSLADIVGLISRFREEDLNFLSSKQQV